MAEPEASDKVGSGGGERSSTPWDKGAGGDGVKIFFSALRAPVWFKNKGRAWLPRAPSLYPPLDSKVSQQFWLRL